MKLNLVVLILLVLLFQKMKKSSFVLLLLLLIVGRRWWWTRVSDITLTITIFQTHIERELTVDSESFTWSGGRELFSQQDHIVVVILLAKCSGTAGWGWGIGEGEALTDWIGLVTTSEAARGIRAVCLSKVFAGRRSNSCCWWRWECCVGRDVMLSGSKWWKW